MVHLNVIQLEMGMEKGCYVNRSNKIRLSIFSLKEKFNRYDSIDEDVLRCYSEFALASQIFYAMKEGLVSELSARMTAMDGASKNAGKYGVLLSIELRVSWM